MSKTFKHHSFAILLHKVNESDALCVFLVQANGPRYWESPNTNIWGLPKGRRDKGETPFEAAKREFLEETGCELPVGRYKKFMSHRRSKAKREITVFRCKVKRFDDACFNGSNLKTRKWPYKSGGVVEYPETLNAQWFTIEDALEITLPGQRKILKRLRKRHIKHEARNMVAFNNYM